MHIPLLSNARPPGGYLHSRMYFAAKELSARLILAVVPPSPTTASFPPPYPRWWNLRCYGAVKAEWNYRIFSRTSRAPRMTRASFRRRRLQYVFLLSGAISYTFLVNSVFRRETGRLTSRRIVLNASTANAARATYNAGVTMSTLVRKSVHESSCSPHTCHVSHLLYVSYFRLSPFLILHGEYARNDDADVLDSFSLRYVTFIPGLLKFFD